MKFKFSLLLWGLVLLPLGFSAQGAETKISKVGVMKFEVGGTLDASLGKFLSETFTSQLVGSKQYTVVDWEEIDRVLGMEAKSQATVSAEDARRMAISKLGLEKLFLGSVVKLGTKYHLTVKLLGLDLRVERMEQVAASSEDELPETAKGLAALFVGGKIEAPVARSPAAGSTPVTSSLETKSAATSAAGQSATDPSRATKENPWVNSLGMKFVPVPGTKVLFCIWDTRVRDFSAFVEATDYDATTGMFTVGSDGGKQRGDTWKSPGFPQSPSHPVCGVSWEDAKAFSRWLTEKDRKAGMLTIDQSYRLPTDAEWSIAVGLEEESGGTAKEKSGKIKDAYPWGTQWPPPSDAGNYAGSEALNGDWPKNWETIEGYRDSYPQTSPVGSFKQNRYGLFDMSGNVWQWCEDWYDANQKQRVLRGGSWSYGTSAYLLSSFRLINIPALRNSPFGFRCVLVAGTFRP